MESIYSCCISHFVKSQVDFLRHIGCFDGNTGLEALEVSLYLLIFFWTLPWTLVLMTLGVWSVMLWRWERFQPYVSRINFVQVYTVHSVVDHRHHTTTKPDFDETRLKILAFLSCVKCSRVSYMTSRKSVVLQHGNCQAAVPQIFLVNQNWDSPSITQTQESLTKVLNLAMRKDLVRSINFSALFAELILLGSHCKHLFIICHPYFHRILKQRIHTMDACPTLGPWAAWDSRTEMALSAFEENEDAAHWLEV